MNISHEVLIPFYSRYKDPLIVTSANGHYVETQYGDLLDLNSGYWTAILGHKRKETMEFLSRGYFAHLFGEIHPSAIELAENLCNRTGYAKVLFGTSGTEANDTAIRLSWQNSLAYGSDKKKGLLVIDSGFHGTSGVSLFASGFKYRKRWLPLGMSVRCLGLWSTNISINSETARGKLLSEDIEWDRLSAFIFEPILGVGGIRNLNDTVYSLIAEKCKEEQILIIADEVTTGLGRTGTFLASEKLNPKPDIICLGKALTNGEFPLSAVLVSQEVWDRIENSSINERERYLFGSTYGGHPTGCLIAQKVLEIMDSDKLLTKVREKGKWLRKQLQLLQDSCDQIREIRGIGLMWGIELRTRTQAEYVYNALLKQGIRIGVEGRTLTILPPFTTSYEELNEAIKKLERTIRNV